MMEWRRQETAKQDRPTNARFFSCQSFAASSETTEEKQLAATDQSNVGFAQDEKEARSSGSKSASSVICSEVERTSLRIQTNDRWSRYPDRIAKPTKAGDGGRGNTQPPAKKSKGAGRRDRKGDSVLSDSSDKTGSCSSKNLGRGKRSAAKNMKKRGAVATTESDDHDTDISLDDLETSEEIEESGAREQDHINNLSQKSCDVIVCKYLKVAALRSLLLESHIKPLAKELNLKIRGKDKHWLITDLARELVQSKRVKVCGPYSSILPDQVVKLK